MAGKHGWNDLENYLHVLERVLSDHPFVIDHSLTIETSPEGGRICGEVSCHEKVVLSVTKYYVVRAVRRRKQARTSDYSYHARTKRGRDLLRYDSAPHYPHHPTSHHKHSFKSGRETVTHVGENWPHLSEVFDELQALFWEVS